MKRLFSTTTTRGYGLMHSSWFKIEHQGMKQYELLARGSAFLLQSAPIAVLSAHVAAPHAFPNYFKQDWLEHLTDHHCRTRLQTNAEHDGITVPLLNGFRHPTLDLAAFPLPDQEALSIVQPLTLSSLAAKGDEVSIHGYRLIGDSGSGEELHVSATMKGVIKEIDGSRIFVDTGDEYTEMGMCGAPLVKDGKCIGVLEGLIPPLQPGEDGGNYKHLRACSVFIGGEELDLFLRHVCAHITTESHKQTT